MRITPLPTEVRYILKEHHKILETELPLPAIPVSDEEQDELPIVITETPRGDPFPDAPVFVFKPLNGREKNTWMRELFKDEEDLGTTEKYIQLFEDRLVRIENLFIGDELFDKTKHLDHLELRWMIEVGAEAFAYSHIGQEMSGKSF